MMEYEDGCPSCSGNLLSQEARILKAMWHGTMPFSPEMKGSTPYTSSDQCIIDMASGHVASAPHYYGLGDEAVKVEAERLAALFNRQWSAHLSEEDIQALWDAGYVTDFYDEKPTAKQYNIDSFKRFRGASESALCIEARLRKHGESFWCETCGGNG